jgi:hypothetical protein
MLKPVLAGSYFSREPQSQFQLYLKIWKNPKFQLKNW